MKKILLLGGSAQQVIAIKTAKRLGYYTILCDFLADNPGQYEADKFYLISTTDKEAVLEVAMNESINGILAYASDPAAPTAAYVAEKMGLPTNPFQAVDILCNKDKFRRFLNENNFNAPIAEGYTNYKVNKNLFQLPVIIKPIDSSGSKGVTILRSWKDLELALNYAFSFSRVHKVIVEEYIEKSHKYLIGGDVFVIDGQVVLWGLLNCHRDSNVNLLVPVGKSYPLSLKSSSMSAVKNTLQDMISKLGIEFGSINVELIVDKDDQVWPIDIGPRAGGNMIPDLLGMIFGVDVVQMAILCAMGEKIEIKPEKEHLYLATHNLHTSNNGIYRGIEFSDELQSKIVKACLYKHEGEEVSYFDNAAKALGIIFMKFESQKEMDTILENINSLYKVVLK